MFKELILAIIIGAILGLGLTGGYLSMQHRNNPPQKEQIITEPTLVPTSNQQPDSNSEKTIDNNIKINSPENNSLLNSDKTDISGVTSKNSNIIITTQTKSFIGKSDETGKFKIPITLENGFNMVKITSVDSSNNQKDTSINITYSTAKI